MTVRSVELMFLVDMETHTPAPGERLTIIRGKLCARLDAEGPRYGVGRMVDLLVLEVMTYFIGLIISRAEQRLQQQEACREDAVTAGGVAAADADDGADRREVADAADAGRRVAGRRVAGSAAVDAVAGTPVIDGATQEDCIRDEGAVGAACGRWHVVVMAWTVSALDSGRRVLDVPLEETGQFAKTELRTRVELCRFRSGIAMLADCCRWRQCTATRAATMAATAASDRLVKPLRSHHLARWSN